MIPKEIKKSHVDRAIRRIDREGVPKRRHSTKYDLIHEGRTYPPKYVLSLAAKFAVGRELLPDQFTGGDESNRFLERRGFKIRQFRK